MRNVRYANPSNRKDPRTEKRENPKWDVETYYYELIDDLETVADKYKSEYAHYNLFIDMLKAARAAECRRNAGSSFDSKQL